MPKPTHAVRSEMQQVEQRLQGLDVDELRELTQSLLTFGAESPQTQLAQRALRQAERPDPRRPRRDIGVTLRVRGDLSSTRPPVSRRLDLSSSLTLDQVHAVLQAAFGFTDSHLHRFAVGPSLYDDDSALYLCRWDVEDGETNRIDEREVRIDELLVDPGDRLLYVYDFGDDWTVSIKLEKVIARGQDEPPARCLAGRRAGPPEDCGGPWGFEELVESGEWDLEFDLEATDDDVRHAVDGADSVPPLVMEVLSTLPPGETADELYLLAQQAELDSVPPVDVETAKRAVARYRWLIERLGANGVRLTAAGHLPPALVTTIMTELRPDNGWIGKANREVRTPPVAHFRRSAHELGIVRAAKGQLTVTAAARRLADDPVALWARVVERLPLARAGSAERHACLLALLWTAAGRTAREDVFAAFTQRVMTEAGWRSGTDPLTEWQIWRLTDDIHGVLQATGGLEPVGPASFHERVTRDGILLARTVLARR